MTKFDPNVYKAKDWSKCSPGEGALVPEASTSAASAVPTDASTGAQPVVPGRDISEITIGFEDTLKCESSFAI